MDKSLFDRWAADYDDSILRNSNLFPFTGYYDVITAVISHVAPKKGMLVLDIGIGTGLLASELVKYGCVIHGLDISRAMIEKAQIRVPDGQFDVVDVDKYGLGKFSKNRYDRIISTYCFHHFTTERQLELIDSATKNNMTERALMIIADIGFEDETRYEQARSQYRDGWDNEEYYLCGNVMVSSIRESGNLAEFRQISECAGILICQKSQSL